MTRRLRTAVLGALLLVVLLFGAAWLAFVLSKSRSWQAFGELVTQVPTARPVVALTFDDGPGAFTEEVLDLLSQRDVPATFFVIGEAMAERPASGARMVADGHELGNHTYSHRNMLLKSTAFMRDELARTDDEIREAGYRGDIHVRPPYGKRLFGFPWVLSRAGRKTVLWSIEPDSYPEIAASADSVLAHVLERLGPGAIILLHVETSSRVVNREVLPDLIDAIRAEGYSFVTVSDLLAEPGGQAAH